MNQVIVGRGGVGKTHLLRDLARKSKAKNIAILSQNDEFSNYEGLERVHYFSTDKRKEFTMQLEKWRNEKVKATVFLDNGNDSDPDGVEAQKWFVIAKHEELDWDIHLTRQLDVPEILFSSADRIALIEAHKKPNEFERVI